MLPNMSVCQEWKSRTMMTNERLEEIRAYIEYFEMDSTQEKLAIPAHVLPKHTIIHAVKMLRDTLAEIDLLREENDTLRTLLSIHE